MKKFNTMDLFCNIVNRIYSPLMNAIYVKQVFTVALSFWLISNANSQTIPRLVVPTGHTSYISSIAFSPDEKFVVTASKGYNAIVWEVSTGKAIHILEDAQILDAATGKKVVALENLHSPEFSSTLKHLTFISDKTKVTVWDAESFTLKKIIDVGEEINKTAISPDGKYVAVAARDVGIWETLSGKLLCKIQEHISRGEGMWFSPNSKLLITERRGADAIWEVSSGKEVRYKDHEFDLGSAQFSPLINNSTLLSLIH